MKKYKVFFYCGDELTIKTRVSKGLAWVDANGLHIESGPGIVTVPANEITFVELFRLHGTMRVIRVDHSKGRLFLSVVRLMIGQFAFVNFLATGALKDGVAGLIKRPN